MFHVVQLERFCFPVLSEPPTCLLSPVRVRVTLGRHWGRALSTAQKEKCPGTAFAVGTLAPFFPSSDVTDSEKEGEASFSRGLRVLHPGRSGGKVRRPDTYQPPFGG